MIESLWTKIAAARLVWSETQDDGGGTSWSTCRLEVIYSENGKDWEEVDAETVYWEIKRREVNDASSLEPYQRAEFALMDRYDIRSAEVVEPW